MNKDFALLAYFKTPSELLHAAQKAHEAGYRKFDAFSPFPIHGMDHAMGLKPSVVGVISAVGSLTFCGIAILLQGWTSAIQYPLVLSGKEFFSYQAFVPITFELSILGAALFAILGMFHFNKLGFLYNPLFNSEKFKVTNDDGFALGIEVRDPMFDDAKTMAFLQSLQPTDIEMVKEEE
ncbi:MAG: DUF3341 domain-containing protein [Bdellovibrionales bacterium]|nr:DUF3341 domain-containing protein [Bdellovibrionales bacterium]